MLKLKNFIHFPLFLVALAVGLLSVYLTEPPKHVIYIYPTPSNIDQFSYRDEADNCFKYKSDKVTCPADKREITEVPIQT